MFLFAFEIMLFSSLILQRAQLWKIAIIHNAVPWKCMYVFISLVNSSHVDYIDSYVWIWFWSSGLHKMRDYGGKRARGGCGDYCHYILLFGAYTQDCLPLRPCAWARRIAIGFGKYKFHSLWRYYHTTSCYYILSRVCRVIPNPADSVISR